MKKTWKSIVSICIIITMLGLNLNAVFASNTLITTTEEKIQAENTLENKEQKVNQSSEVIDLQKSDNQQEINQVEENTVMNSSTTEQQNINEQKIETGIASKEDFNVSYENKRVEKEIHLVVTERNALKDKNLQIKNVYVKITDTKNNKNIKNYAMKKNSDGSYEANINTQEYLQESILLTILIETEILSEETAMQNSNPEMKEIATLPEGTYVELDKIEVSFNKNSSESVVTPETQEETNKTEENNISKGTECKVEVKDLDGKQMKYQCQVSAPGYSDVTVGVWSEANGLDDLKWHPLQKEGNFYMGTITVREFKSTGIYKVHAYGVNSAGTMEFINGAKFLVEKPSVNNTRIEDTSTGFKIIAGGITCPSGIEKISAGIWSAPDQSDIKWNEMEKKESTYVLDVNAMEYATMNGIYNVQLYAVDGNGFKNLVGTLKHKVELSNNKMVIKSENQQSIYKVAVDTKEYTDLSFAVWSDVNGQDDLKWYKAQKTGSTYSYDIKISDHGSYGKYYVHAYGKKQGKESCVCTATFNVDRPKVKTFNVEQTRKGFKVKLEMDASVAGIKSVKAGVWAKDNQSDLEWKILPVVNNQCEFEVNISEHSNMTGNYYIHVYMENKNGISGFCDGFVYHLPIKAENMQVIEEKENFKITVEKFSPIYAVKKVSFAIWSEAKGQDDLQWIEGKRGEDQFHISLSRENLKEAGRYFVHAYATSNSGEEYFVGGLTFKAPLLIEINEPEKGSIPIDIHDAEEGNDFKGFMVEVWTKEDKSDLIKVRSANAVNNTYHLDIPLVNFELYSGDYNIDIYKEFNSSESVKISHNVKIINFDRGILSLPIISDNKMTCNYEITEMKLFGVEENLKVGVWNAKTENPIVKWYTGRKTSTGYKFDIPIYELKETGLYHAHFYADLKNGKSIFLKGSTFDVYKIEPFALEITDINGKDGTAIFKENLGLSEKMSSVSIGVWNAKDTNKIVWYEMKRISENEYTAKFDIKKHDYKFGQFNAHVYGKDLSGNTKFINGKSFTINPDNMIVCNKIDSKNAEIKIYGPNVKGKPVDFLSVATWTADGNQDDLRWDRFKKNDSNVYSVKIQGDAFKRSGVYLTHVYGTVNGVEHFIDGISYTLMKGQVFDEYAKSVMHNIIFAVETGGQVYGNAKYDCFSPAYNLSQKETAITIGAAGWFATEAQRLLKEIKKEDAVMFAALDTQGISKDLETENWRYYGGDRNGHATILRDSDKAKCIQKLISTNAGIKVQNRLVDEQMTKYVNEAEVLGVIDLKARMFCANVRHLGGYSAMKRIIEWCKQDNKILTMENIYTSMREHTTDKNGNGVGANKYNTRHTKVMKWINTYI